MKQSPYLCPSCGRQLQYGHSPRDDRQAGGRVYFCPCDGAHYAIDARGRRRLELPDRVVVVSK